MLDIVLHKTLVDLIIQQIKNRFIKKLINLGELKIQLGKKSNEAIPIKIFLKGILIGYLSFKYLKPKL